jgi:patatin-like phospholipase/acyl hydrolase
LAAWEKDTGLRRVDHFDLIAGTSTGGIVDLLMNAQGEALEKAILEPVRARFLNGVAAEPFQPQS